MPCCLAAFSNATSISSEVLASWMPALLDGKLLNQHELQQARKEGTPAFILIPLHS